MQTTPGGTSAHPVHQASPEPAVEVHGRVMTTNQKAAAACLCNSGDLDGIAGRLPACHATPWQCWP
jgi:hypothetical protein